jgi:hypothetical protein
MLLLHFISSRGALPTIHFDYVREYAQVGDDHPTECCASIWISFKTLEKLANDCAAIALMLAFTAVAIVPGVYREFTPPENWPNELGRAL